MAEKTEQLQIRMTPGEKTTLKSLARAAGQTLSRYVLARVLPPSRLRFGELLAALAEGEGVRFALAELNELLSGLDGDQLRAATEGADLQALSPYLQNYVAAMVELAAHRAEVPPPAWVREVEPLDRPHFAVPLKSLRPHLLRHAPVPFKRRNLFVDSSLGDLV